jgi:arylsulfatase
VNSTLSNNAALKWRSLFYTGISLIAAFALSAIGLVAGAHAQQQQSQNQPQASSGKPNILVIFGDDIGQSNISAYTHGLMGYQTPNIDRIAHDGTMFTDYYAEQSCTAGRSSFITGQSVFRTGLSKVGFPGAAAA